MSDVGRSLTFGFSLSLKPAWLFHLVGIDLDAW